MDLTRPEDLAQYAEDVRRFEKPFIAEASAAFEHLFAAEYRRLRASALESGEEVAVLNVTVRCNFASGERSIDMQTAPAPTQMKPRRKAVPIHAPK